MSPFVSICAYVLLLHPHVATARSYGAHKVPVMINGRRESLQSEHTHTPTNRTYTVLALQVAPAGRSCTPGMGGLYRRLG